MAIPRRSTLLLIGESFQLDLNAQVQYDCLPRLADAVLALHEPPDMHFLRSTISLAFTAQRLRAEAYLGYMPDQVSVGLC